MTNEKKFPKTISQWEFDYGLFINLPRIIVACDLFPSSFKLKRSILLFSKEVSYLSWQSTYPNLKATCYIKLKFFWRTKLLENLLHATHLITIAATLILFLHISILTILVLILPLVFTNKSELQALLFSRLSANHLNKIFEALSKDRMTCLCLCCLHIVCYRPRN